MDLLMPGLRILHISFAVFWIGSAALWLLFLRPQLRRLGTDIERPVERALDRVTGPAFGISSLVVVVTGVAMVLILNGADLGTFVTTGRGQATLVAFVTTTVALLMGFALELPLGVRTEKLLSSIEQGVGDRGQLEGELTGLYRRRDVTNWTAFVLLLIALVAMASARYL